MNKLFSLSFFVLICCLNTSACESGSTFDYSVSNQTAFFEADIHLPEGFADYTLFWDLGDGTTSVLPEPVHTYNGTEFNVCLTITFLAHDLSCEEVVCSELIFESGVACVMNAAFGWVEEEGVLQAEDLSSSGFFTTQESQSWSVDGEWVANTSSLEVEFSDPNDYEVCLSVYGSAYDETCQSTKCEIVSVIGAIPVWSPVFEISSLENCRFRFTDTSGLPEGVTLEDRTWLVDGEPMQEEGQWLAAQFNDPGEHEISLVLTWSWNGGQEQSSTTQTVTSDCTSELMPDKPEKWKVEVIGQQIQVQSKSALEEAPLLILFDLQGRKVWEGKSSYLSYREAIDHSGYFVLFVKDGIESTSKTLFLP